MDQFESNQQGSIRQKHNQWYYRLRTLDENGKWISHEFKGGATKKETERMLREALDQYNERGFMFQPGNVTVSELADMWYNDEVEHSAITPRGREGYKHVIRQIKESSLGTTKLRYVSIEHIQAYVDGQYYGTYDESGEQLTPLSFVCCKTDGELLTTQTLKYLNKLVQKELPHIEHFHFHCLRHSYASMLVANGANFKDVQALMGHSDIRLTLNTYSHVTKQSRRKAINILEAAIQENIQRKGS